MSAYQYFDWPFFTENTHYTDQSTALKMGGGWEYTVDPITEAARQFHLHFDALQWFTRLQGNAPAVDYDTFPEINAGRLDRFYNQHRLHKPFWLEHPKYGLIKVRFAEPLSLPKPEKHSLGVLKSVTVKLQETH